MPENRKNLDPFYDLNVKYQGMQVSSSSTPSFFSSTALEVHYLSFPKFYVNRVWYGGEQVKITKSNLPTEMVLKLTDGTTQKIRMHGEALTAISLVHPKNRACFKEMLIEHKLLIKTLDELKENNPAVKNLYLKISRLKKHASSLANLDPERSTAAYTLATKLEEKVNQFLSQTLHNIPTKKEFANFKNEFEILANSQEPLLGRHRAIWKPIIANILLALTGLGAILILGKLVYKASTSDKLADMNFNNSFFFGHTTLESCKNQVKNSVDSDLVTCEPSPAPALK